MCLRKAAQAYNAGWLQRIPQQINNTNVIDVGKYQEEHNLMRDSPSQKYINLFINKLVCQVYLCLLHNIRKEYVEDVYATYRFRTIITMINVGSMTCSLV